MNRRKSESKKTTSVMVIPFVHHSDSPLPRIFEAASYTLSTWNSYRPVYKAICSIEDNRPFTARVHKPRAIPFQRRITWHIPYALKPCAAAFRTARGDIFPVSFHRGLSKLSFRPLFVGLCSIFYCHNVPPCNRDSTIANPLYRPYGALRHLRCRWAQLRQVSNCAYSASGASPGAVSS